MLKPILLSLLIAGPAAAGGVTVTAASAELETIGWRFDVTLRHADTGWDHYADAWEIRDASGTVLGHRPLAHPHVNEQPFTRSLRGVDIPDEVTSVQVFARDSQHGWSETGFVLDLP